MPHPLKVENANHTHFITVRTMNSKLWFVNNPALQYLITAFLAKYQEVYDITIYAFIIMGNHYHLMARFPDCNKAAFLRDFNSIIARLTNDYVAEFEGGKLWARRAADQVLPLAGDVEHWFFYLALNPVSSGIVERTTDFNGYNSFSKAISKAKEKYNLVDWSDYNNRRRYNQKLAPKHCSKTYVLKYSRLPGYEDLSQSEYRKKMLKKLEERRVAIVQTLKASGRSFPTIPAIRSIKPGARPFITKKSQRYSKRPLVLTLCRQAREDYLAWYFNIVVQFKKASRRYLAREHDVMFPTGTYKPPLFLMPSLAPT